MRSQLARIEQGVAVGPATTLFQVDLDGQTPVTLFLENMSQKASLSLRTGGDDAGSLIPASREPAFVTQRGGKNSCVKFVAKAAGIGGAAASQVYSLIAAGPAFTDETGDFNDVGADDVALGDGDADDILYIGAAAQFSGVVINTSTVGTVGTVAWEYWNGAAWAALVVADGTVGFKVAGPQTVLFVAPTNWAAVVVNGGAAAFFIRARVLVPYTIDPLIAQGSLGTAVAPGNTATIEMTAAPSQTFSITNLLSAFTINLACDASGRPTMTPNSLIAAIEDGTGVAAAYTAAIDTVLAEGSDGSGIFELYPGSTTHVIPVTALAGGTAATTTGNTTVSVSPQPISEGGPFVTVAAAGTALSAVVLDTVRQVTLTGIAVGSSETSYPVPIGVKGLRVSVVGGAAGTWLVLTVVASPTR